MRVLFLATRSPWPSADGGRVLMAGTIDGLRRRGHHVTVMAPRAPGAAVEAPCGEGLDTMLVPVDRPTLGGTAARALGGRPVSIARHAHPAMARAVAARAGAPIDIVHVEQLQALPHADGLRGRGLPLVLRAENVESDLWSAMSAHAWWGFAARWDTTRLRRWERDALGGVDATAAVSARDADALRRLAPEAEVDVVRIPMRAGLDAGATPLSGTPAITLLASAWFPNRDGAAWFVREMWPAVAAVLPAARLHLFGSIAAHHAGPGIVAHAAPADARDAFPAGSIMVVPLRIASGANVRILEAWARGLPVVATPVAAAGLDLAGSPAITLADTPAAFAAAFAQLGTPGSASRAVEAGRAILRERHDPARLATDLEGVYTRAIARRAGRGAA